MLRALSIQSELEQIGTIQDLTSVFESIASLKIAKVKDQVVSSKKFFDELWQIYSQLRADPSEQLVSAKPKNRQVYVVITGEGGLMGDIDDRIVERMSKDYDPNTTDIIVIGGHGATLMAQRHMPIERYFKMPDIEQRADITSIITAINDYAQAAVYYQTYVSLAVQDVSRIDLISAVKTLSASTEKGQEVISSVDYIFEPTLQDIIDYMESIMLGVALGQVILESKLAQYASRFNAMNAAKKKANDMDKDLRMMFNRAKRAEADERLKEVVSAMEQS